MQEDRETRERHPETEGGRDGERERQRERDTHEDKWECRHPRRQSSRAALAKSGPSSDEVVCRLLAEQPGSWGGVPEPKRDEAAAFVRKERSDVVRFIAESVSPFSSVFCQRRLGRSKVGFLFGIFLQGYNELTVVSGFGGQRVMWGLSLPKAKTTPTLDP